MVYSHNSYFRCFIWLFSIITMLTAQILPIYSFEDIQTKGLFKIFDFYWILEGIQSFDENTPSQDVIDFAAKVKHKIQKVTGQKFKVKKLFEFVKIHFKEHGIKVRKHNIDFLVKKINEAEKRLYPKKKSHLQNKSILLSKGKGKPDKDSDSYCTTLSPMQIIGYVSAFCGALILCIPIPGASFVGNNLIGFGLAYAIGPEVEAWIMELEESNSNSKEKKK